MTRTYSVTVRGKQHEWSFRVQATEEHVADWRADGLEVFELVNTVPVWVNDIGLTRAWVFLQDLWNLPSNWGRKR